jgi:hypothetical protein
MGKRLTHLLNYDAVVAHINANLEDGQGFFERGAFSDGLIRNFKRNFNSSLPLNVRKGVSAPLLLKGGDPYFSPVLYKVGRLYVQRIDSDDNPFHAEDMDEIVFQFSKPLLYKDGSRIEAGHRLEVSQQFVDGYKFGEYSRKDSCEGWRVADLTRLIPDEVIIPSGK